VETAARTVRKISVLRPLAWRWWLPACALGLLLGQPLGAAGTRPLLLTIAAATGAPALVGAHRAAGTASVLVASFAALGALQAWYDERARTGSAERFPAAAQSIRGRVVAVRLHRARAGRTGVSLDLSLTQATPELARGEVVRLAIWQTSRPWRVGDHVAARAATRPPRGFCNDGVDGFARAAWRQGVVAVAAVGDDRAVEVTPWTGGAGDPRALLFAVRRGIGRALAETVPAVAERSVLSALIYGDQSAIPSPLRDAYARTGTAHVLSVSGLHIAVVAAAAFGSLRWLLVRCGDLALRTLVVRWAAVAALAPATGYALLSGGAVATMRALAMGALGLGAVALLRRPDAWSALSAAALLLCAGDPGVAAEASFQLSFAAVAALLAVGGRLASWPACVAGHEVHTVSSRARRAARGLLGAVVAAVAAGVVTGPITAYHFGSVALLGVVANLVVVPLVGSLALLLGLAGAAMLPLASTAAALPIALAASVIAPCNRLVVWLADLPGAALDAGLPSAVHVTALLLAFAATVAPRGRVRRMTAVVALLLLGGVALGWLHERFEPRLVMRFLDVGQGDAILVRTPGKRGVLVDAGGLGGAYDPGARVVIPALRRAGLGSLAVMVLSHPDHDHHGGLAAVARQVPIEEFWSSGQGSTSASYRAASSVLDERRVVRRRAVSGTTRVLDDGTELRVVHPMSTSDARSRNDGSLVLRVAYGATRLLLTGDVEASGEAELLRRGELVGATVVKVPHHGSRTSSSRAFVATARPALSVALLGAENRFGFPALEVRRRHASMGAAWLQSDRDGEVVVVSDGQLERVATCRQG